MDPISLIPEAPSSGREVHMNKTTLRLLLFALVTAILLMHGCQRHDRQPQGTPDTHGGQGVERAAAPSAQGEAATPDRTAPGPAGEPVRSMSVGKAYTAFVESFSVKLGGGDSLENLNERIALVEKARMEALMISSDIRDPNEASFLSRYTDLLDRYLDLARRHAATLEEDASLRRQGIELEQKISSLKDAEKNKATLEFNALWERHQELSKGRLAQERKELEELGRKLVSLK